MVICFKGSAPIFWRVKGKGLYEDILQEEHLRTLNGVEMILQNRQTNTQKQCDPISSQFLQFFLILSGIQSVFGHTGLYDPHP